MSEICDCGRPAHYVGHHYSDTSQPGMHLTWCMCGGLGNFHHTSIEATTDANLIVTDSKRKRKGAAMEAGDRVRYLDTDWANRFELTLMYISAWDALKRVAVVRWPSGEEYAVSPDDIEYVADE